MSELDFAYHKRAEWGAGPSPAPYAGVGHGVIVHWNGPAMGAYSRERVPELVANTYAFHVHQRGWMDIAYNFSIDRFGDVWEGRGDYKYNGASGTNYANENLLAVELLMGESDEFTPAMQIGLARMVAAYIATGRRAAVMGHCDVTNTACPGPEVHTYVHNQLLKVARALAEGVYLDEAEKKAEPEMPLYLIEATDSTTYGVYADGRVRRLIYPELQYLYSKNQTLEVVRTTNKENDALVYARSQLP